MNADPVVARCEVISLAGNAWRIHKQRYRATDPRGSLIVSGRYHRGADQFDPDKTFPVLYTSLSPETSLAELIRHIDAVMLPMLNAFRITTLAFELSEIVDLRDPESVDLARDSLVDDRSIGCTQAIGAAANARGAEGLLVPSASLLGDNLIIFPENLKDSSQIRIVESRDPRLRIVS